MLVRPVCPECGGAGKLRIGRMAVQGTSTGTGFVAEDCKDCGGEGTLKPIPAKIYP